MKQKDGTADPLSQLLDAATEGLAGDAELALDVRAELATHIEEKREELHAKGQSESDALDLALKSFGPATDLAAELVRANARRMKLRAVARLAIRAALVPAAVVVAVLICGSLALRDMDSWLEGVVLHGHGWQAFSWPDVEARVARLGLSDDSKLILFGDPKRPTPSEQQRAIWEAHPEDKVFYGNYVTLLVKKEPEFAVFHGKPRRAKKKDIAFLEREIGRGMDLDPQNARYDYLLAELLLKEACDVACPPPTVLKPFRDRDEKLVTVIDRHVLDRAMALYVKAGEKPYLKAYTREMLGLRISLLPPARRIEESYVKISMVTHGFRPNLLGRFLGMAAPYAEVLISEGRAREARQVLDAWYPLFTKFSRDAHTGCELVVSRGLLETVKRRFPAAYEKLGDQGAAERVRRLAARLAEPVDAWLSAVRQHRATGGEAGLERDIARSGNSMIAGLIFDHDPAAVQQIDLGPLREMEHAVMEQAGLAVMLPLLLVLMLGAVVATLRWRWARGMRSAPLLLLPSWREAARILGVGVLAPLAVFYVYTRWSGLAGREFSVGYLFPRFVLELCLLTLTISFLTISLAGACVRKRCAVLGVEMPPPPRKGRRVAVAIILGVLGATCLFLRERDAASRVAVLVAIAGAVALLCTAVAVTMRLLVVRGQHGLFVGTVARSLVPVFAAAAILVAGIAHPYLAARETALLQADRTLAMDAEHPVLWKVEADLVRRLKAEIKQAIVEIDAEIEAEKAQEE